MKLWCNKEEGMLMLFSCGVCVYAVRMLAESTFQGQA